MLRLEGVIGSALIFLLLLVGCGDEAAVQMVGQMTVNGESLLATTKPITMAERTQNGPSLKGSEGTLESQSSKKIETIMVQETSIESVTKATELERGDVSSEKKVVWLSFLDLQPIFAKGTESSYRAYMTTVFANLKANDMTTLMYQVRPFGDALYPSEVFPTSFIVTGTEGDELAYDPFGIALELAREVGIEVEAWINPFRIRSAGSSVALPIDGRAYKWLNDGSRRVLQTQDGTIVYNPANEEVRALIVEGVEEILDHYSVTGIHFDDYFYPTTDEGFDEQEYRLALKTSQSIERSEWRRGNVNTLIREVYTGIKANNPQVVFGISPQGDIEENYNGLYADVALWMKTPGYVDYMMPQIYFGFQHDTMPFKETLAEWYAIKGDHVQLLPGIAAYKIGQVDKWAGSGSMEWVENVGILGDMVQEAQGYTDYSGYAMFRYDFLYPAGVAEKERMLLELQSIKDKGAKE